MSDGHAIQPFYGRTVVAGAFVLAMFGWGLGFYGPPIYLHAVIERTGWPIAFVSTAVTVHFLSGAFVVANLARLHRRLGVPFVTTVGALFLASGVAGWGFASEPWQLVFAACVSGFGWACLGAATVNAIISPWFDRTRPAALAMAYNGASIGGVVFSPLWVALIAVLGFAQAGLLMGSATVIVMATLAYSVFAKSPAQLGQHPDGAAASIVAPVRKSSMAPRSSLYRDGRFIGLAAGMSLGIFAQVGLLAHLYSLLVPAVGAQPAGVAMGLATASAIAGRTLVGWLLPRHADRRIAAALGYGVQAVGCLLLFGAGADAMIRPLCGVLLFGSGIGNAISLPPLIAQDEFDAQDVARVVPLVIAISQATYAFAPAAFGLLRSLVDADVASAYSAASAVLTATVAIQCVAIACFIGSRRSGSKHNS